MANNKYKRSVSIVIITVCLIALVFFLLRGPYLSNTIKRIIIPVLENATGESIISDNAVINLFPFYFQVKSLRVFDKDGNRLLWVTKTRAYIDLLGLLSGELRIRRMTMKEPRLSASKEAIEKIRSNINRYLSSKDGGGVRIGIKNIVMTDGEYVISAIGEIREISGTGLVADILVKNAMTVNVSQKEGILRIKNRPDFRYGLDGKMVVRRDGEVDISELMIKSAGSSLKTDGVITLSEDGKVKGGRLNGKAEILEDTVMNFFGINEKRDGELSVSGSVLLLPSAGTWPGFSLELETSGWFYLETLMKILGVKDNITGKVAADGHISGEYPDLAGIASGRLDKAEFGHLPLDYVTGEIVYKDKMFNFVNLVAHTFQGELRGEASIRIPHGDYMVSASLEKIGSPEFFDFIRWDAPFSRGIISGDVNLDRIHSHNMEVRADVMYKNTSSSDNGLIDRIDEFNGLIEYDESVVDIRGGTFRSKDSTLLMDGTIDLKNRTLDLALDLDSSDSTDLTAPSVMFIKAPASFTGRASGAFDNPEIAGSLNMGSGSIKGLPFSHASGDVTYRISSLSSDLLRIENENAYYDISGSILFRKADKMFSYDDPFYSSAIHFKDAHAGMLIKAFYKELPLSGNVNGTVRLEGGSDGLNGEAKLVLENLNVYGQKFDKITITSDFEPDKVNVPSVLAYRGDSRLEAEGFFSFDERYRFSASSKGVYLHDIDLLNRHPVDAHIRLKIDGSGTIDNPDADFSVNIIDSNVRGKGTGKGEIIGSLRGEKLHIKGNMLDGIISAESRATLSGNMLWSLDLSFDKGRYDPLFAALLQNGQEDISASVSGYASLSGIGKDVSMDAKFTSAVLSLYGYSFRNVGEIVLGLSDRIFSITSFTLAGDDAEVEISGNMNIGKDLDVNVEGNIDVVPLRALYPFITSLKGRGDIEVAVIGSWDSPSLTGQIDLQDATASMDRFPYRIGPLNGSILLKEDRFTFESLKTGLAGGDIEISGVGYFKELSLKRVYVSSTIKGVKVRPDDKVRAVIDGDLFYETSSKGSSLTGAIDIRKAFYEKRFEWKTWLLGLKETVNDSNKQSSFFDDTKMSIHITGDDNIVIDNNIARAPVMMDLTATGTLARYGLVGKIEAKEGKIYFRSNEFEILDGRLDFIEPDYIAPVFHIKAETFTRGYRVKLNLDGSIDKLVMTLYADPPLSDTDILTLLTSGQISREESGFESGLAVGEATAILTGSLQDVIESEVNQLTGIERFEITPETTQAGSLSPRVTVGKRFMGDKLFVVYSTSIGTTEENIYKLEYDIARNVSIVGSRDEIGSAGVDLKYRFEFD